MSSQQETFRAKFSYQARLQQLVSNFAKHTVSDIFAMKMIALVRNLALCIIVNSNLPDNNNNCKNNNKNDNSRKNRLRLFPVPLISRNSLTGNSQFQKSQEVPLTRTFIHRKNIHATREVAFSEEELSNSRNRLRGITLEIVRTIWAFTNLSCITKVNPM